ncbi:hypothetical protein HZH68_002989 [Vespula germanica]|uniref:Uncharacterized protein n=1 Tax=Vespula germanica TaxID=30212 RepID=A0A834NNI9_VESGE|nr:hypothetical protein HZH68_002989 [Vespula germanica]
MHNSGIVTGEDIANLASMKIRSDLSASPECLVRRTSTLQGRVLSIMVETLMDFVRTQGNREKLDGGLGDLATGYKEAESIEDLWYRMRKYGETSPYPVWRKVFSLLLNSKTYANQRTVLSSKLINDIKCNQNVDTCGTFKTLYNRIVLGYSEKYEIKEKRFYVKDFIVFFALVEIIRHSTCIPDGSEESSFPDRENVLSKRGLNERRSQRSRGPFFMHFLSTIIQLSNPTTLIDTNGRFYHQLSPKTDLTVDGEPTTPCRSSFVSNINISNSADSTSQAAQQQHPVGGIHAA